MARVYCHYEDCETSFGVEYKGLFIELNNCVACIIAHDTKPNCLRFGILPKSWSVGNEMRFIKDVRIEFMKERKEYNMEAMKPIIQDKLDRLFKKFKSNPDGFVMNMQKITKRPKKEDRFIRWDEIVRKW